MVLVAAHDASPHSSIYDFDSDDAWQSVDIEFEYPTAGGSVTLLPSPASASLSGFAIINHHPGTMPSSSRSVSVSASGSSQVGISPVPLPCGDVSASFYLPASDLPASDLPASGPLRQEEEYLVEEASVGSAGFAEDVFMTPQQYLFSTGDQLVSSQELMDLVPFMSGFQANVPVAAAPDSTRPTPQSMRQQGQSNLDPSDVNFSSWKEAGSSSYASSSPIILTPPSTGSASPRSPAATETSRKSASASSSASSPSGRSIHKVVRGKIEKTSSARNSNSGSSSQFVIVTPTTISAHAGRPNPFECFEAMRTTTHKGRKGPLANETKQSALQVRRVGACFCCHSRKVKCDKERPCRHCKRLMLQVPQVVCWQFQDFVPVLFPNFIRGHFKKDAMARFFAEHVETLTVGGVRREFRVELSSGPRFSSVLSVRASFFTARTFDVLQHWHLAGDGAGRQNQQLHTRGSAPIAVEMKGERRDELKKLTRTYVRELVEEPLWAEQLTDSLRTTRLPRKILSITQAYARRSESAMVKRALSIYTMHYIMTRHLCLTRQSILSLGAAGFAVPQNEGQSWVTSRVLARQLKSLFDEQIMREMTLLFEQFSKALKPKSRREWAPCLASFLVLCLFMEAVETASDNYVALGARTGDSDSGPGDWMDRRKLVLDTCREVENMPFKQFAYQFHQLYQTHSRDANTRSFNPLLDGNWRDLSHGGELDEPAMEMISELRELFYGEDWHELQFLAGDEMVLRGEGGFVMDRSFLYTGRLVAKCLLSFTNEAIIFDGQI